MTYRHARSTVSNLGYHIVWSTKYRRKVLVGPVESTLKALLLQVALNHGFQIKYLEVMPDHVHVFAVCRPDQSPQFIYKCLKGATGRLLFLHFPQLRRYFWAGRRWNPSTFVESIGHISEATVKRYIEDQKAA